MVNLLLSDGKIEKIADAGTSISSEKSLDLGGAYVSPGWIDLHAHLYPLRRGGCGTKESKIGLSTGVTAILDAGTVGADNFEDYKSLVMDRAETKIYCLLNIKSRGIRFWNIGRVNTGEDNIDAMLEIKKKYPGLIKGVKVTASKEHMAQDDPMYYVRKAIEAGERLKLPVMIHFGLTPPELEEMLPLMRPGDILTHCLRNADHHIFDSAGKIRRSVLEAKQRGVLFDIGHGVRSFSFPSLERALGQGFDDFSISSDLYILSVPYRARNFSHILSKFLAAGMSLEAVMERASERPAKILGIERGIAEGKPAELSIFRLREGSFVFKDCWGVAKTGKQLIEPAFAVSNGSLYSI